MDMDMDNPNIHSLKNDIPIINLDILEEDMLNNKSSGTVRSISASLRDIKTCYSDSKWAQDNPGITYCISNKIL